MRRGLDFLVSCWHAAEAQRDVIVLGAGRWGRVWAGVAAEAGGPGASVVLVARNNFPETTAWHAQSGFRDRVIVVPAPEYALRPGRPSASRHPATAIVASRPKDHLRDLDFCLAHGLPALVEKPFAVDPEAARSRVDLAAGLALPIGLGAEFSLLPALHWLADVIGDWRGEMLLTWIDPAYEHRHGSVKRRHEEATVLTDLAGHAVAIFDVIAVRSGGGALDWQLVSAEENVRQPTAELILARPGLRARLTACTKGNTRSRTLEIRCNDGRNVTLDFSGPNPEVHISGLPKEVPAHYRALDSTLRLELGAWFRHLDGADKEEQPAIVEMVTAHIDLCEAISDATRGT